MNIDKCLQIDIDLTIIGLKAKVIEFEMKRAEAIRDGHEPTERYACQALVDLGVLLVEAEKLKGGE